MVRFGKTWLFLFVCVGCGSRPLPDSLAKQSIQTPRLNPVASPASQDPKTVAPPQPRIEAKAVIVAGTLDKPKVPLPHEALVTLAGAQRILFATASPAANEIFALAQMSNDTYGGAFFVVRLDGGTIQAEKVMDGTNLSNFESPRWSPDGGTAYFVFDSGNIDPENTSGHGLFSWDRTTGKVSQILGDSIGGLAISDDGTLAGFWDYSLGDKLTVYNLKSKRVVRAWGGQTHTADDLELSDMVFTPDGKSLLARLFVPKEDPVMRYEIASGTIAPFAGNVQSMAAAGGALYFLQFSPVPFTNPEHPHRLSKWVEGAAEPSTVLEDFPYMDLGGSHGSPWLLAGSAVGYAGGAAIYDTRTGQMQTAGRSCDYAIVTASGKILYIFGNEFVSDATVCAGPPPARHASAE